MADITTHLERLAKTAMELEIPVLLEAKEEILRLREALRRYACGCEIRHCGVSIHECGWVARAALGEKE